MANSDSQIANLEQLIELVNSTSSDYEASDAIKSIVEELIGIVKDQRERIAQLEVHVSELRYKTGITEVDEIREQAEEEQ